VSGPAPRIVLSEPIAEALDTGRPVACLETSVLAQGLPPPHNRTSADEMADAVREAGAEPGYVWIDAGAVRIGASPTDLDRLSGGAPAAKVARRDLPMAVAGGGLGATTVSATLWAAARSGIEVMATGGIGGVHPGSGDVSADLLELARTPGTVVCSGPKSIVDPAATLERLEELGVGVVGFGVDRLPFFLSRNSGLDLEHHTDSVADVAAMARARGELSVQSALLVCNPVPEDAALPDEGVRTAVRACIEEAGRRGVTGKAVTPFLLTCLGERTGGASLRANLALLEANAALAGRIASILAGQSSL
jgi:pseudouridine-5'-phosphate glycosidase